MTIIREGIHTAQWHPTIWSFHDMVEEENGFSYCRKCYLATPIPEIYWRVCNE